VKSKGAIRKVKTKYPLLQVALDFINLSRAIKVAREAVRGGCDWVEAGTPLIKSEGLNAIRTLRKEFPGRMIVADMKTMDAGRIEVEAAAKAGADIVCVLGAATDATIKECVEAGVNYGAKIQADLIAVDNPVSRAKQLETMGVDFIGIHCAIDEQMGGKDLFGELKKISKIVNVPLAIAGGIFSENAAMGVKLGAGIVIVGGAITKADDPLKAAEGIKKAITQKVSIKSKYFKRADLKSIKGILQKVSVSNVSDAMHRADVIKGLTPLSPGTKLVGRVLTVRTYPGDWAKAVQAVDEAEPGDVLVIDSGGTTPAIWGELATHGAMQRGIAGIVVNGAVRDTAEIKKLKFPVFTKLITPQAGEPKGFGEIGVPLSITGIKIVTGDWIACDDDGICIIPAGKLVEVVNRAMSVLETENRLRKEIDEGSTLAGVTELLRWEKQK